MTKTFRPVITVGLDVSIFAERVSDVVNAVVAVVEEAVRTSDATQPLDLWSLDEAAYNVGGVAGVRSVNCAYVEADSSFPEVICDVQIVNRP